MSIQLMEEQRLLLQPEFEDYNDDEEENNKNGKNKKSCGAENFCFAFICISVPTFIFLCVGLLILFHLLFPKTGSEITCSSSCEVFVVENFATEMTLEMEEQTMLTGSVYEDILKTSESVKMMELELDLSNKAPKEAGGDIGNNVIEKLVSHLNRGGKLQLILNENRNSGHDYDYDDDDENKDVESLKKLGAEIYYVNHELCLQDGIFNTKTIIGDNSFFIGSGDTNWKSMTQNKEFGIYIRNCSCLKDDVEKIFDMYKHIIEKKISCSDNLIEKSLENGFPYSKSKTTINMDESITCPFKDEFNSSVFISSSPQYLNPEGRTNSLDSILNAIEKCEKEINVEVMEYYPVNLNEYPKKFFVTIENALKDAVLRNVSVRILLNKWNHTNDGMFQLAKELESFSNYCNVENKNDEKWCTGKIEVKVFEIPDPKKFYPAIPYSRASRGKFLISGDNVIVSTSNWAGEYFYDYAGIDISLKGGKIASLFKKVFERDWNSEYSQDLDDYI